MKPKIEVHLCVEHYTGKVTRYKKKDVAAAEKGAVFWLNRIQPVGYVKDVWIETREVMPAVRLEDSEVRP